MFVIIIIILIKTCGIYAIIIAGSGLTYNHLPDMTASYCCLWLTLAGQFYVVVKVKACYHATLLLAEVPGMTRHNVYEIVLGNNYNTHSEIRLGVNGTAMAEANTDNLLDCKEYRAFWVSWGNHLISVGQGAVPGQNRFMFWQDLDPFPFPITSLSVGAFDVGAATWQFDIFTGNAHIVSITYLSLKTRTCIIVL